LKSSGFVLLHKPAGLTSFNALFPLKRIFKTKRVGHAGTLDLRASGLIVAGVQRATRLLPYIESSDKFYTFRLHLGYSTETLEWDGPLIKQDTSTSISKDQLDIVLDQFRGAITQIPPNYSAVKVNGVRASDLTLQGKAFDLKSRPVHIYELEIIQENPEVPLNASGTAYSSFDIKCHCSKGTYIRSLCRDIGEALGTLGVVSNITRTQIGNIPLEKAHFTEEIGVEHLLSPDQVLDFPVLELSSEQSKIIRNGNWIPWKSAVENLGPDSHVFLKAADGEVISLSRFEPGRISPKLFIGSTP
jgi:tRNA pseudouridine55 synthase